MNCFSYKSNNKGVIALLLVIMITTLTLVSSIILSMNNISDMMASYHMSEAANVNTEIDSCIDDALYRISSSSDVTGSYFINLANISCEYEIGAALAGLKFVTTTASTTSGVGSWTKTVITTVNVSTSPIRIEAYKDSVSSFDSYIIPICGDGNPEGDEVCDDGNEVTETQTCGNGSQEIGTFCNADCTAVIVLDEACDDGNQFTEQCGNSIQEIGTFCNSNCTVETTLNEACDSNLTNECSIASGYYKDNYTDTEAQCFEGKFQGISCNTDCTDCLTNVSCQ